MYSECHVENLHYICSLCDSEITCVDNELMYMYLVLMDEKSRFRSIFIVMKEVLARVVCHQTDRCRVKKMKMGIY